MGHREKAAGPLYDLASSTGPAWTLHELERMTGLGAGLDEVALSYAPPEGSPALRKAIGEYLDVDPDWVTVTTGASEALAILAWVIGRPKAPILLPNPGFPPFAAMAGRTGMAREYLLQRELGFALSNGEIIDQAKDAAFVIVNTPHNPTGSVVPYDQVAELARMLARKGVPLVVDEVYHPIYHGTTGRSTAGLENVIAIGDMSKSLSLPGLRIGWIVDPDPGSRTAMADARAYLTLSSSPLNEAIGVHALSSSNVLLDVAGQTCAKNLALLSQAMADLGEFLDWVPPAGGTTAFPWLKSGSSANELCEQLANAGVLVVPGHCFGHADHFRIAFGAERDFGDALEIFVPIVESHG